MPMNRACAIAIAFGLCASLARAASAQEGHGDAAEAPRSPGTPPSVSDLDRRLRELEAQNARLREELDQLKDSQGFIEQQVERLLPLSGRLSGYLDFGFFYVGGNGSGIQSDIGHKYFPEYGDVTDSWVFYGDPLSTVINSRGDPADTELSRAVVFDPVRSNGKASFIVNALNLTLFAGIGEDLTLNGSVDFVPRGRDVSVAGDTALGDFIDVKLAYVEYMVPIESFKLSLYAGKFDSVLGFEYRAREAPDRMGVTPSLLCRYTCGSPLGLKARAQLWEETVALNVSVTNGSHGTESFPFYDEIDSNQWKTVAGRISSKAPIGTGLEVGVSGSAGAQDLQDDEGVLHWHYGVDLHLDWNDFDFTAEWLQGMASGSTAPGDLPCENTQCLRYKGAYGQLGYRWLNWLTPYTRVDFRDALHQNGESFVYISELLRVTGGARVELGSSVILKAEYTLTRELGNAPEFPNDVFTSSMVIRH
jgi:transposase-like protein